MCIVLSYCSLIVPSSNVPECRNNSPKSSAVRVGRRFKCPSSTKELLRLFVYHWNSQSCENTTRKFHWHFLNCYLETHTLSPLRVISCCHTSKSKLSKVSSNIRSPEQSFFSFDDFLKPLKLAVVTVFSHFALAPRTPSRTPASTTRENRLKNIFTILFSVLFVVTVDAFDLSDG